MNNHLKQKPLEAILSLISITIIVSGLVYKIYALNQLGVIISLGIALIFWLGLIRIMPKETNQIKANNFKIKSLRIWDWILMATYLILNLSLIDILWQSRSGEALTSPWTVIPNYFFIFYFLATLILLGLIIRAQKNKTLYWLNLGLISAHYFLSFIIAVIIYKIGYGYDPFIHQATMDLIDKQGSVEPKPFYYLGQYGLLVTIHKITGWSLIVLDKLLVPILSAIFLPLALNSFSNKYFKDQQFKQILLLIALIIPFSLFILTTPQNLAFLFLILTTLYSTTNHRLALILALATCLIHPLAGIPALALALLMLINHYHLKFNKNTIKISYLLIFIFTSLGLPLAFYLSGQSQLVWDLNSFNSFLITLAPSPNLPYKETYLLNLIYVYGKNIQLIITVLIISGLALTYHKHKQNFKLMAPTIIAIAILGAYFLISQLSFNLISYEQNDFAKRLLIVIVILSFPAIFLALAKLTEKIIKQNKFYKTIFLVFLTILIATSLYLSYPRADHYYNSKAYAVSKSDQEAVNWIEKQTENKYIVLANQQTSAMALRSFGFNRYYHNIYFYPIPTSGPLYQYFLDMVYTQANRETMIKAMELAQVNEAYFILPKYWWAFSRVLAEAKLSSDSWQEIGEGQLYIFKYTNK
ncbi:MAG: hypothetical protein WC564_02485 [Patescibacteria group bacterium]